MHDVTEPDTSSGALTVQTYTSSSSGYIDIQVNSHLIMGPSHALLVDGQLLVADAQQVVAMVKTSGCTLDTVFLTHHPDHWAGFAVIQQTSDVLADYQGSAQATLTYLDNGLGGLIASTVVPLTALTGGGAGPILRAAEATNAGTSDAGDPRVALAVSGIEVAFPA